MLEKAGMFFGFAASVYLMSIRANATDFSHGFTAAATVANIVDKP